jgi:hypothetical protein
VAVTGHRNLVTSELDGIRTRVRELFEFLRSRYPDTSLRLMSPLAEGADQLTAEVALECGVSLVVPLPMAVPEYLEDFAEAGAVQRFHELCEEADDVYVLSADRDNMSRAERYAQLGIFQAAHCHVLLAIWDGKDSDKLGGTSQVVRFHHDDIMPGIATKSGISQQMLINDESDLVYTITCSRDEPDGAPAEGMLPLDWFWFTKDEHEPRSKILPPSHDQVFRRANDFSRDTTRFTHRIAVESDSLLSAAGAELEIDGLDEFDRSFREADFLAIHYQRKSLRTLRITHTLAFAMGTLFIMYSDNVSWQLLLYLFLACFVAATILQKLATRRGWFRKYLDYRTLAEGLRVQLYWAMAGISQQDLKHYSHDNFLQLQDPEVGWIRNAMRVAGTKYDASPHQDGAALNLAIDTWVGGEASGQVEYYMRKAVERTKHRRITEGLGKISLSASAVVVVLLLVAAPRIPEALTAPLLTLMGITLLLFGIRHAYAHAIAESELIRQYEFMFRIFANARKRLDLPLDNEQRRQVLMALGSAALDEHSQWLMMHRERSLDQAEIWRMGSGT